MVDYSHNQMDLNGSKECGRNNLVEITKSRKRYRLVKNDRLVMKLVEPDPVVVKIRLDW